MMIFPRLRWKSCLLYNVFVIVSLVLFSFFVISFINYMIKWNNVQNIIDSDECPFCYGTELCQMYENNNIEISSSFLDIFVSFISVKNVYKVRYNKKYAILKKLAHNWELTEFDEKVCKIFNVKCKDNNMNKQILNFENFKLLDDNSILKMIKDVVDYNKDKMLAKNFIVCPNTASVETLVAPLINNLQSMLNIWTIVSVNVEPIILKFLNMDKYSWAVPKYYGVCGRSVLVEYIGETLYSFKFKDYAHRVDISLKLLHIAFTFTFQHDLFRFYLTDVSLDNIAINEDGNPIIIDLENLIILNKKSNMNKTYNESIHNSEVIPCENCFGYSVEEICQHGLSDHNIYVFCILINEDILNSNSQTPEIQEALLECVNPTKSSNRFEAANYLKTIFEQTFNNLRNISRRDKKEFK